MIISCENCNKNFEVDSNQIPEKGRLLQCSACDHKWFYKLPKFEVLELSESKKIEEEDKNLPIESKKVEINTKYKQNKFGNIIFKSFAYFVVFFITLIAIIIIPPSKPNTIEIITTKLRNLFLHTFLHEIFKRVNRFILS